MNLKYNDTSDKIIWKIKQKDIRWFADRADANCAGTITLYSAGEYMGMITIDNMRKIVKEFDKHFPKQ